MNSTVLPTPSQVTRPEDLPRSTATMAEAEQGPALSALLDQVRDEATARGDAMNKPALIAECDRLAGSLPDARRWLLSQRPADSANKTKWIRFYAMACRGTVPERDELTSLEHAAEVDRRADTDVIRLGQPSEAFLSWQAELLDAGLDPVTLVARMAERVEDALRCRVEQRLRADYLRHRLDGLDPRDAAARVQASVMSDLLHRAARQAGGRQGLEDAAQVEAVRSFLRAVQWVLPVPLMV